MRHLRFCIAALAIGSVSSHAIEWDAKNYNENSVSQKHAAERLIASEDLKKDANLLDVGCGDGKITASLADRLHGHVVGVDISQTMIDYARKTFEGGKPTLSFSVVDAAHLSYENQFDYVTSFSALQWVRDQKAALKGMHAALKESGQLLITMPRHYPECLSNAILDVAYAGANGQRFSQFEMGQVFFGVQEYSDLLKEAGFTDVNVSYVNGHDRFPSLIAFQNFVKQWLPWAQVFTDPTEKDAFMGQLMARYSAYCPVADDGSVVFLKQQLEAKARKPKASERAQTEL